MSAVDRAPDLHWQARGACTSPTVSPETLYPPEKNPAAVRAAKVVCFTCPVRVRCAETAMAEEEGVARDKRHGVRGGLTSGERYRLDPTLRARTKPTSSGRPPAGCGTSAAYDRHVRNDEPIDDACQAANTARSQARRKAAS